MADNPDGMTVRQVKRCADTVRWLHDSMDRYDAMPEGEANNHVDFRAQEGYPEDDITEDDIMDSGHPPGRCKKPGKTQQEILQRARRIETRLTGLIVAMGYDTESQRPTLVDGRVQLPSRHTSMQQVIDIIPDDSVGPVEVYIGDRLIAMVDKC